MLLGGGYSIVFGGRTRKRQRVSFLSWWCCVRKERKERRFGLSVVIGVAGERRGWFGLGV